MTTLIIAASARALAASATRAGEVVRTIDWFGDDDTVALADACERVPPGPGGAGFDRALLETALARLAPGVDRIVYGAGFETEPDLIDLLGRHAPVAGNAADTVRHLKEPAGFAALLSTLGARHPAIRFDPPGEPGWLAKRAGGSGGGHVRPAEASSADPALYFQRQVFGKAISVLFVADGRRAVPLGLSRQWTLPAPDSPFRYGGCVGPIELPLAQVTELDALCGQLVAATGLVGLNGIDCLIGKDGAIWVLEVNPRPVASIDLFDRLNGLSLWTAHLGACQGHLPVRPIFPAAARAASVVYASKAFTMPGDFAWPGEAVDRTPGGTIISVGDPICSLITDGDSPSVAQAKNNDAARRLQERLGRLR
jgi:predicted ATP-grasp superfamily ATP-dependent carboligase